LTAHVLAQDVIKTNKKCE